MTAAREAVKLGFTEVERFSGGMDMWTFDGHYRDVATQVEAQVLRAAGAIFVDTRSTTAHAAGKIAGSIHATASDLQSDPVSALGGIQTTDTVVLYGVGGAPDAALANAAQAVEGAGFRTLYVYSGGWTDWTANGGATE